MVLTSEREATGAPVDDRLALPAMEWGYTSVQERASSTRSSDRGDLIGVNDLANAPKRSRSHPGA